MLDVSRLNRFVLCSHCKRETNRRILQAIRQGDWSISLDLSDASFASNIQQVSLHSPILIRGVYEFRALPFGLCTARLVFTRLATSKVAPFLRQWAFGIYVYFDNWLILHQNSLALLGLIPEILTFVKNLGFLVNEKKSRISPAQQFECLGLLLDTTV